MNKRICVAWLFLAALLLSGCTIPTVEQMYSLPKRPDSYNDLQSVIDVSMENMDYSAPRSGDNQQTVQMADLDGDGIREYLLFAKGSGERPLKILIFANTDDTFRLVDMLECSGTSFDKVEYVQVDGKDGMELVVGCQLSQQVPGVVNAYAFPDLCAEQLLSVGYAELFTIDLDQNGCEELLVLRPGEENDNAIAQLYGWQENGVYGCGELVLSVPAENIRRLVGGNLTSEKKAIFITGIRNGTSAITDVCVLSDGLLVNVTSGTDAVVPLVSDYCPYPADMDGDGIIEIPTPISGKPFPASDTGEGYLLCWYSSSETGEQTEKIHTYHHGAGDWYLELNPDWSERICVTRTDHTIRFHLWNQNFDSTQEIFSILVLDGQNREQQAVTDNRFVVYRSDTVIYAARMEVASGALSMGREDLINRFHIIYQVWKTGEI